MKLSVVSTLFCSSPHVVEFVERIKRVADELVGNDFEIILVNDGSPDDSLKKAVELCSKCNNLYVLDLSRNFGHHKAIMTGLKYAKGDLIFLIDSDLEEEPEWLKNFFTVLVENKQDVIYGVQSKRKGDFFEKISGEVFYYLFKVLTGLNISKNFVTARLMTKRYVDALLRHEEREVFLAGLWHITGFDQKPVIVTKHSTSKSTYNFRRKMTMLVNSITAFSNLPLVGIFYLGVCIFFFAFLYTSYLVINWLFFLRPLTGWTSLMASVWLLGGMIISFIGVVGIYLSKIFLEVKQRPYSIVKEVYGEHKK